MLKITRLTDYAVVLMTQMAQAPATMTWVTVTQLAKETGVPSPTVAKVMQMLIAAGFIKSQRGAYGGYSLIRAADSLSVAEIIMAFEGPITLTACISGVESHCEIQDLCPLRGHWDTVNEAIQQVLENVSLADIVTSKKTTLHSKQRLEPSIQDHDNKNDAFKP